MQNTFEHDNEAIQTHELEIAKQMALKFVSARMRTTHEVMEYLQKKGCTHEQARATVLFLKEYQYLDDALYCHAWIHDRIQFHPCGRQKMAAELRKKISDSRLIAESLDAYFPYEDELALAKAAVAQKMRNHTGKKQLSREQLSRFLYTRGYSGSIIGEVCGEINFLSQSDIEEFSWQDDF